MVTFEYSAGAYRVVIDDGETSYINIPPQLDAQSKAKQLAQDIAFWKDLEYVEPWSKALASG